MCVGRVVRWELEEVSLVGAVSDDFSPASGRAELDELMVMARLVARCEE